MIKLTNSAQRILDVGLSILRMGHIYLDLSKGDKSLPNRRLLKIGNLGTSCSGEGYDP